MILDMLRNKMEIHGIVFSELIEDNAAFTCIFWIFCGIVKKSSWDSFIDSQIDDFRVIVQTFGNLFFDYFLQYSHFSIDLLFKLSFRDSLSVNDQNWGHPIFLNAINYFLGLFIVGFQPVIEYDFVLKIGQSIFPSDAISTMSVYFRLVLVGSSDERNGEFSIGRWGRRWKSSTCNLKIWSKLNFHFFVNLSAFGSLHFLFKSLVSKV